MGAHRLGELLGQTWQEGGEDREPLPFAIHLESPDVACRLMDNPAAVYVDALPLLAAAMADLGPGELVKTDLGLMELMGAVEVRSLAVLCGGETELIVRRR